MTTYYRLGDDVDESDISIVKSLVSVGTLVIDTPGPIVGGYTNDEWRRLGRDKNYRLFDARNDDGEIIEGVSVYRHNGKDVIVRGTPPGYYYFVSSSARKREEVLNG